MNFEQDVFRAPVKKLNDIFVIVKNILCTAAANKRWALVKALAPLARKKPIHAPRHSNGKNIPSITPRHGLLCRIMVGHRTVDPTLQAT